ncbi:TPA: polysaccharide biosynthesis tyrosine autokinase [Klebsiella quasipneumoniae subsp. quasipneumoniae]|nr:polysaccharide biosynthesis tyrosine autokinase [Klebsiella quasipneumoniae subsp. quasipneumoniae]
MSIVSKQNSLEEKDDIDFGRLIGEIIDHRKVIISITSFVTLLTLIYILFSTPIYQADALIQVEQKQGNAILNSLSQVLPNSQPQSAPEISLLQSRMILGKTVDDLNLQTRIEESYFPIFGEGWARLWRDEKNKISISKFDIKNIENKDDLDISLKVIDSSHYEVYVNDKLQIKGVTGNFISGGNISIKVDDIKSTPGTIFSLTYVSKLKAINDLRDALTIADQGKDTGMLVLSLTGSNPDLIKKQLESISNNYLEQNISRQAAQDAKSLDFLNIQLPKVRNELDVAEGKLNDYRRQNDSVDLSLEAKSVLDQIVNVENQLNELTFKESEISQLYTKEHPTYKALLEKRKTLQEEKNKLNKRVASMPETQQEILRLSRDVESGRAVFMQLLNRQQELNIAKSSAIGNVRIIDQAIAQPKPVKPKKSLLLIIGVVVGLIFSLSVVLLKVLLRRGIESPEQLEEVGINVYASVPVSDSVANSRIKNGRHFVKNKDVKNLLALENPADLAIESIRGLRTSLHFAMMEAKNNILMISGASPNAGKTFISSNLAATIAHSDKKVLFIDADMRKGYSHKVFKTNNDKGLSDWLSGNAEIQETIKYISDVNLDVITRGIVPPNPAELLMHSRLEELLSWAEKNYDLVIVDTPPILAVTDAAIISAYVGTSLLVARFEENTVKEIEFAIKRFEQSGSIIRGCILNGVVRKASSYYSYGYNNYGYVYEKNKD